MRPAERPTGAPGLDAASTYLAACVDNGLLPAAVVEIGTSEGVRGSAAHGASADAIFDLASLTKVLGTGLVALGLVGARELDLDAPVARLLPSWRGRDRADVSVRDLLAHTSGLPAHAPLYERCAGAEALVAACAATPLVAPPRTTAIYSDLGFIVLGAAIEAVGGAALSRQVDETLARVSATPPRYGPVTETTRVQATGVSTWRERLLRGEVHDDNAAAMGGVAGHAGLFGTVGAVGDVARAVLRGTRGQTGPLGPPWACKAFARRSPVAASSRALAWDTALPTSSCGRFLSASSIGHTGFTGTSLWIDPVNDLYVALLTNRTAGRASASDIARIRRVVSDTIGEAWLATSHE